jgi:hypothetical protein
MRLKCILYLTENTHYYKDRSVSAVGEAIVPDDWSVTVDGKCSPVPVSADLVTRGLPRPENN